MDNSLMRTYETLIVHHIPLVHRAVSTKHNALNMGKQPSSYGLPDLSSSGTISWPGRQRDRSHSLPSRDCSVVNKTLNARDNHSPNKLKSKDLQECCDSLMSHDNENINSPCFDQGSTTGTEVGCLNTNRRSRADHVGHGKARRRPFRAASCPTGQNDNDVRIKRHSLQYHRTDHPVMRYVNSLDGETERHSLHFTHESLEETEEELDNEQNDKYILTDKETGKHLCDTKKMSIPAGYPCLSENSFDFDGQSTESVSKNLCTEDNDISTSVWLSFTSSSKSQVEDKNSQQCDRRLDSCYVTCSDISCCICSTHGRNISSQEDLVAEEFDCFGEEKSNLYEQQRAAICSSSSMQWSPLESESFYLDLQSSPCDSQPLLNSSEAESFTSCPQLTSPAEDDGKDSNCNVQGLYHEEVDLGIEVEEVRPPPNDLRGDARLVQAMQNYYRLVTVDLSAHSTPIGTAACSSAESSASSEELYLPSVTPVSEYYLFEPKGVKTPDLTTWFEASSILNTSTCKPKEVSTSHRQRSKSYDQSLRRKPLQGVVSFERLLSCPSHLSSELASNESTPQRCVTSFAKIARAKKKGLGTSPPVSKHNECASLQISPVEEGPLVSHVSPDLQHVSTGSHSSYGENCCAFAGLQRETTKGTEDVFNSTHLCSPCQNMPLIDGAYSTLPDIYSKNHRPTTLPIQPFILHHNFSRSRSSCPAQVPRQCFQQSTTFASKLPIRHVDGQPLGEKVATFEHCERVPVKEKNEHSSSPDGFRSIEESSNNLQRRHDKEDGTLLIRHAQGCKINRVIFKLFVLSLTGLSIPQLHSFLKDFNPEYFSIVEKPPDEFCLSPEASTMSLSMDVSEKRGQCVFYAIKMPGVWRDPGVAKLGDSAICPNVGHLLLKYLCPAIAGVLGDGLRPFQLDFIVGRRKNSLWHVVEASRQPGTSTKPLNALYSQLNQMFELSTNNMRFNAFIFGLLNLCCLDTWLSHLHEQEGVVNAYYQTGSLLDKSHPPCLPLFEEILLLLQPLVLLPFHLDLVFEFCTKQRRQEQIAQRECLHSQFGLQRSLHSTLQLMLNWGTNSSSESSPPPTNIGDIAHQVEVQNVEKNQEVSASENDPAKLLRTISTHSQDVDWWEQLKESSQMYLTSASQGNEPLQAVWSKYLHLYRKVYKTVETKWQSNEVKNNAKTELYVTEPQNNNESDELSRNIQGSKSPCDDQVKNVTSVHCRNVAHVSNLVGSPPDSEFHNSGTDGIDVLNVEDKGLCGEVKAVCDQPTNDPDHLCFPKGAILKVISNIDSNWIMCSFEGKSGLVPVAYITHFDDADY
uniref:RUN and SH3 domain containing 2 n=1 Tax=Eptatretus burgeri TaxID=7764 RepID=A0A8C4R388_EPTBU